MASLVSVYCVLLTYIPLWLSLAHVFLDVLTLQTMMGLVRIGKEGEVQLMEMQSQSYKKVHATQLIFLIISTHQHPLETATVSHSKPTSTSLHISTTSRSYTWKSKLHSKRYSACNNAFYRHHLFPSWVSGGRASRHPRRCHQQTPQWSDGYCDRHTIGDMQCSG